MFDLKKLIDMKNIEEEIKGGYIRKVMHPDDNSLFILKYTQKTQAEKRWNKYTMMCRGLIVRESKKDGLTNTYQIVAKGFDKFFNYGENPEYEKDIDFSEKYSIYEKLDGSLGIGYIHNGEMKFATQGSFTSVQANKANEIWKKKYDKVYKDYFGDNKLTPLVEIIAEESKNVVDYSDYEDLVLIGLVRNGNEDIFDRDALVGFAKVMEMPVAQEYIHTPLHRLLEIKKDIDKDEEGWVLVFSNGKRLKIKGDEYLKFHRAVWGLTYKKKLTMWYEGKIGELISIAPEEFEDEIKEFEDNMNSILKTVKSFAIMFYHGTYREGMTDKEFADMINDEGGILKPLIFEYKNKQKISDEKAKRVVFKNTKEDEYDKWLGLI